MPTAGTGAAGDYYIDSTGDDIYGPKSGTGFGVEQRITISGAPDTDVSGYEYGIRVQFVRAGRITRLRYYRRAATSATVNLNIWNSGGGLAAGPLADSTAGVGYHEVTLPTPLAVAAGSIYTFSYGPNVGTMGGIQPVTDTADCLKQPGSYFNSPGTWPNSAGGGTPYVEPIYEPEVSPWPLALETVVGGGTTILSDVGPPNGDGVAGDYYADTLNGKLYGPKSATGISEQELVISGTPNTNNSAWTFGTRDRFNRDGIIRKVRYTRHASSSATLTVAVWNAAGAKLTEIADTQATVLGTFTVTLPTPVNVSAGSILYFSYTGSQIPRMSSPNQPVTSPPDMTFLNYCSANSSNTFPSGVDGGSSFYVWPILELSDAWPLTVRAPAYLQGAGPPDAAFGIANDYYADILNGILYGPKSGAGWGAEQKITIANSPDSWTNTTGTYGVQVRFARRGRVAKVRYVRTNLGTGRVTIQAWKDSTQTKMAEVSDDQGVVVGAFTVTFPTPVVVEANETWTFAWSASTSSLRSGNVAVTGTADVTFLNHRSVLAANTWPNANNTNTTYVEPIFEPDEAWPITVRSIATVTTALALKADKATTIADDRPADRRR